MVSAASVKDKAVDTREQLKQLRDQIEALMTDQVSQATDRAQDIYRTASTRAGSAYRSASDTVQDTTEQVAGQVRDRPLAAIMIAAGAGWLIGRIFR